MKIEVLTFKEKRSDENTYLQVAALGSPKAYYDIHGVETSEEHKRLFALLKNTPVNECLNEWRKLAYWCDVAHNRTEQCDFLVEEDSDGIYLMAKVDSVADLKAKQLGRW